MSKYLKALWMTITVLVIVATVVWLANDFPFVLLTIVAVFLLVCLYGISLLAVEMFFPEDKRE